MTARILVIEAEGKLSRWLAAENFEIECATDGESGVSKAAAGDFDLILLAASLPGRTGFAVCRALRRRGVDTALFMMVARAVAEERVAALRLGADDCVPGSCDPHEILARVEALLRRVPRARRCSMRSLCFGNVEIDFRVEEVRKSGRWVTISPKELRLLQYLANHRERVVSRQELLQNVWEYGAVSGSRTIDVHIGWLRQKLEDNAQRPKHIMTVRGLGYRFDREFRGER